MAYRIKVSSRGAITLPAAVRRKLGIGSGHLLVLEEKPEGIVLTPCLPGFHRYSDAEIEEWAVADRLEDDERDRLLDVLKVCRP